MYKLNRNKVFKKHFYTQQKVFNFLKDWKQKKIELTWEIESPFKIQLYENISRWIVGQEKAKKYIVNSVIEAIESIRTRKDKY